MVHDAVRRRHSSPVEEEAEEAAQRARGRNEHTLAHTDRPQSHAAGIASSSTSSMNTNTPPQPERNSSHEHPRHVRFSTEAERRPHTSSGSGLGVDSDSASLPPAVGSVSPAWRSGMPSLSIDTSQAHGIHSASSPTAPGPLLPSLASPGSPGDTSPPSPRSASRARGYSLRRTIFNKNISDHTDDAHGLAIELGEAGPSKPPGSAAAVHSRNATTKKSLDATVTAIDEEADVGAFIEQDVKQGMSLTRRTTLPHYENWLQQRASRTRLAKKLTHTFHNARKRILNIREIPPSKDGRHIDMDAQRKSPLTDERTNRPYIGNKIRSSRYNAWNFLPRQLWAQFSKLANAYFLCVAILQMIPGLSTTGTYTTIVPLMFFITISIAKEGYDDLRRYKLDKEENNRSAQVFRVDQPLKRPSLSSDELETSTTGPNVWADMKWKNLQVGDIVRIKRDEQIPADVVLLSAATEHDTAYIETMALDGETNLKSKSPPPPLAQACNTPDKLSTCGAHVVVEDPNLDLYNFEGRVTINGETASLSNNEIIYRGSVLRNTPEALGLVVFTGEECKIRMNASKNPRIKAPSLQFLVNKIIIGMVIFVLALSIWNTVAYQIWSEEVEENAWYLSKAGVDFMPILVSFIIMFNTLIPLSLYVSLEIVKVFQRLLLNDMDMYDEDLDTPMEARTSTINEELGQISYIFSDKTGTLTDNSMKFRKMSVAGTAWLHDTDLKEDALKQRQRLRRRKSKGKRTALPAPYDERVSSARHETPARKSMSAAESKSTAIASSHAALDEESSTPAWKSTARPTKSQPELHTLEMIRYIQRRPFTMFAKKARFFLLSIALCHTCLPETKEDGSINYQASSPDELALVQAAQELEYMLVDRQTGVLTIKTFPRGADQQPQLDEYEVLDVIEFSSKRKRMSALVRFPDQRICVLSKGADSTMINLLKLSSLAQQKAAEIGRRESIRKSVEARQAIARRSEQIERSPSGPYPGRPSIGGISRASLSGPRVAYRGQLDQWLKERENDVDASAMDDQTAYSPRPSAQLTRPSMASSRSSSFQSDDLDEHELVEEALVIDEPAVIERCFQHINDFATEGLRTLLYGYRFVDEQEYQNWRKLYRDATTSLVDRQAEIERAGDLIEHSLDLAGATAIEDKLQKGVPEAIEKLRRAGIKMWMLTGDKRETAINIGHSCRLIKDYSTVTVLDVEDPNLEQLLASTIVSITDPSSMKSIAHSVVVIDGATLSHIDSSPTLKSLFTDLASLVDSLICCRASPAQKASLVRSIRRKVRKSITLAIGDGANDIAMIQEAHVGIGITGKEGLQAARTSDYSIAQFRFLTKLLLVHGRWNYLRTAKYTAATFWKEMMFYLTQALYQRYAGYTGTSLYESWSLTTFNTLFTSLPVIMLGVFEKDLQASTLLAVPELYASMGLKNAAFNIRVYAWWIFLAATEAMLIFFVAFSVYGSDDCGALGSTLANSQSRNSTLRNSPLFAAFNISSGGNDNIFAIGCLTFTSVVIIVSAKLQGLEMHNISIANVVSFILSVGGWFLWNVLLSIIYSDNTIYKVKGGFLTGFGTELGWWLTLLLILISVFSLEVGWRALRWVCGDFRWTIWKNRWFDMRFAVPGPTDAEIFQCLEQDPVLRRRFEDAASNELPSSLGPSSQHGSEVVGGDMQREKEEREEAEIQDLLRSRGLGSAARGDDTEQEYERLRLERVKSGRSQSWAV